MKGACRVLISVVRCGIKPDWEGIRNNQVRRAVSLKEIWKRHGDIVYLTKRSMSTEGKKFTQPCTGGNRISIQTKPTHPLKPKISPLYHEGMADEDRGGIDLCLIFCPPLIFPCSFSHILLLSIYWGVFIVLIRYFLNTVFYHG